MADDHKDVPPRAERSVIAKSSSYYTYTKGLAGTASSGGLNWISGKKPWPCAAHHILPGACFSLGNIECNPDSKKFYVMRCILVSKWNINGGKKHEGLQGPKGDNNMVRMPTRKAYVKTYASDLTKFKTPRPVNEPMHGWGGWSEHHIYNEEVKKWLNDEIWSTLQEDKVLHKGKGKDILAKLQDGEKHFRAELVRRGSRTTPKGNQGTVACWLDKQDPNRSLPFSMADDPGKGKQFVTKNPT